MPSLHELRDRHPHLLAEALEAAVTSFAGELTDDLQIRAVRRTALRD